MQNASQESTLTMSPDGQWVWNGAEWVLNSDPAATTSTLLPPTARTPKKKRTGLKIAAGVVGFLAIAGIAAGAGGTDGPSDGAGANQSAVSATSTEAAPADAPEAVPAPAPAPEPEFTLSRQNALRAAETYLQTMAFSRQGLIDQLSSEYGEQFPIEDATWAVDQLTDVDWNEQALRSAENYLEFSSFSRQGLIDQLSSEYGEKFTLEQATWAVNQIGL